MTADTSRNQKLGMLTAFREGQIAEQLLRKGCTARQLAEALECSLKSARAVIKVMQMAGCDIPEAPAGIREEWVYKMAGKSKLFARYE